MSRSAEAGYPCVANASLARARISGRLATSLFVVLRSVFDFAARDSISVQAPGKPASRVKEQPPATKDQPSRYFLSAVKSKPCFFNADAEPVGGGPAPTKVDASFNDVGWRWASVTGGPTSLGRPGASPRRLSRSFRRRLLIKRLTS